MCGSFPSRPFIETLFSYFGTASSVPTARCYYNLTQPVTRLNFKPCAPLGAVILILPNAAKRRSPSSLFRRSVKLNGPARIELTFKV